MTGPLALRLRRSCVGQLVLHGLYRRARRQMKRWRYSGDRFHCPVCDSPVSRFLPYGLPVREHAMCPVCESMERHRLYWLYYTRRTDLLEGGAGARRFLHVAPEMGLETRLQRAPSLRYVTADFFSPYVDLRMDLCHLPLRPGSVDVVHCSHVLEHVPDDRRAMVELLEALRPGGWGLIQAPIWTDQPSWEDASITDPAERERVFGQHDHVRIYGPDYPDRLREAGFEVETVRAADFLGAEEIEHHAVDADEEVYRCTRPLAS